MILGRDIYITTFPVAIWLETARRCTERRQIHMDAAPWGDGAEEKRWGGYPPEPQEGPEVE
eukprot:9756759-Heterocapsa_arctica.AAC.1